MPKFLVRISGENFRIEVEERKYLFWKYRRWKKVGFITTRFVESESANEAIEEVFKIVRKELQENEQITEHSKIELDEIQEDEAAFDLNAPGRGYTFFTQDEENRM